MSLDLVLAGMSWTDAERRGGYMPPDRLIARAVHDDRFARVLVVNPYRSAPVLVARRLSGQRDPGLPPSIASRSLHTPLRIRRHDPTSVRAVAHAHRRYAERVASEASKLGCRRPVLISTDPFLCAFGRLDWAAHVTYFAWDDWASHPHLERWRPAYQAAYSAMREREVRVAAVSPLILDRIAPTGEARSIPNGVADEEFRSPAAAPPWFAALPRPRAVYVGALGHRLDIDVVREVAARFPEGSVALVGPLDEPAVLAPLRQARNIVVHGPVGRRDVVALLHAADVCLLPHRRTALTESMSPLKLYEYLAAGRPVVATDLPGVRGVDPRVELVAEPMQFPNAVARALENGPASDDDRLRFLGENAWGRRLEDLLAFSCGIPA
jgi:teichuronic acid biosynthesis glycosyltransferase TuaH